MFESRSEGRSLTGHLEMHDNHTFKTLQLPSVFSEAERVILFAHVLASVCSSSRGHNQNNDWILNPGGKFAYK